MKLSVLFVYGKNSKRHTYTDQLMFDRLISLIFNWFILFYTFSAVILHFLRRIAGLRHNGFISTIIDVAITFTAGGNLRVSNRLERWFFGILLIGSFFFSSLWLETKLYPSFLHPDRKIDTFHKLAEINPPIYLFPAIKQNSHQHVKDMLRLILC